MLNLDWFINISKDRPQVQSPSAPSARAYIMVMYCRNGYPIVLCGRSDNGFNGFNKIPWVKGITKSVVPLGYGENRTWWGQNLPNILDSFFALIGTLTRGFRENIITHFFACPKKCVEKKGHPMGVCLFSSFGYPGGNLPKAELGATSFLPFSKKSYTNIPKGNKYKTHNSSLLLPVFTATIITNRWYKIRRLVNVVCETGSFVFLLRGSKWWYYPGNKLKVCFWTGITI